jgi:hypothetical protein
MQKMLLFAVAFFSALCYNTINGTLTTEYRRLYQEDMSENQARKPLVRKIFKV